jgi:hypothetical protein
MITHVAIRFKGIIYSLPKPSRHPNLIRYIVETTEATYVDSHGKDQGFLDSAGNYLTRSEALEVAKQFNQLKNGSTGERLGELYSEDVW